VRDRGSTPCGVIADTLLDAYRSAFAVIEWRSAASSHSTAGRRDDAQAVAAQASKCCLRVQRRRCSRAGIARARSAAVGSPAPLDGSASAAVSSSGSRPRSGSLRTARRRGARPRPSRHDLCAWRVAKFVKSNAIVYCARARLGIGAGQRPCRLIGSRLKRSGRARSRARSSRRTRSFRDGLDVVADNGAAAVINRVAAARRPGRRRRGQARHRVVFTGSSLPP
jgi:hypothetical protein